MRPALVVVFVVSWSIIHYLSVGSLLIIRLLHGCCIYVVIGYKFFGVVIGIVPVVLLWGFKIPLSIEHSIFRKRVQLPIVVRRDPTTTTIPAAKTRSPNKKCNPAIRNKHGCVCYSAKETRNLLLMESEAI